jgi:PAS domain S-box-containing protein
MPHNLKLHRSIQEISTLQMNLSDENSGFEKYLSLISIINGFEEYTLDRSGLIISSNLEAVNITGYDEWEVIGKHVSIFYSIEDQLVGKPQNDLDRAERQSPFISTGLRIKKKNPPFWAGIKIRVLKEKDVIVGYKMTLHDATHKAVSEQRVKEFKDEYMSLFNNCFVGFFKFSMTSSVVLMVNEKAQGLLGLAKYSDTFKFDEIFDNEEDFLHLQKKLLQYGSLDDFEFKVRSTDLWVRLSCRYFVERDFVEGILVDATESKKADVELSRLNNELDQFIYHASHEMRSPLVSMLGIVNLIQSEKTLNNAIDLTHVLKNKIVQLDDLLKCITSIAYNNQVPVQYETIQWEKLIVSVLKELQSNHDSKVQVSVKVEQEVFFYNDIARVRTVLKNLISNSLKYFNPACDDSWVRISVRVQTSAALVTVSDNGIGIDHAHLTDIFKMFFKATEYPKGPGLGLYIVKAMTDKMNGTIRVDSTIGQGSSFDLSIPNQLHV